MPPIKRRSVLAGIGTTLAVGLAGCTESQEEPTDDPADTETSMATGTTMDAASVRVAHFSPDAPNVDVYVDGASVLTDVPFRAVSDYLSAPSGTRGVQITVAGDPDTVAFEGDLEVAGGTAYTVAAIGELAGDATEFRPLVLEDDLSDPGSDTARVRVVHASPDAPAVDITVADTGDALVDGAAFGDAATVEVPAGDYTLEVRPDAADNDGDVVATFDVTLEGDTAYTAFAGGYLSPDDESADQSFDLTVAVDSGGMA